MKFKGKYFLICLILSVIISTIIGVLGEENALKLYHSIGGSVTVVLLLLALPGYFILKDYLQDQKKGESKNRKDVISVIKNLSPGNKVFFGIIIIGFTFIILTILGIPENIQINIFMVVFIGVGIIAIFAISKDIIQWLKSIFIKK